MPELLFSFSPSNNSISDFRVLRVGQQSSSPHRPFMWIVALSSVGVILLSFVDLSNAFFNGGRKVTLMKHHSLQPRKIGGPTPRLPRGEVAPSLDAVKFRDVGDMLDSLKDEPVLIMFTAVNCGPCKLQKREMASVVESMGGAVRVLIIETEKWPQVGSRFNVGKLPCLLLMQNKQVLARLEGLTRADELVEQVRPFLGPLVSTSEPSAATPVYKYRQL